MNSWTFSKIFMKQFLVIVTENDMTEQKLKEIKENADRYDTNIFVEANKYNRKITRTNICLLQGCSTFSMCLTDKEIQKYTLLAVKDLNNRKRIYGATYLKVNENLNSGYDAI